MITSKDICAKGIAPDSNTHPTLHMFNVPLDNEATLHRLNYDASKIIMSKNNIIEYEHPKNTDKKVKLMMLNEGKGLSAKKQVKIIISIATSITDNLNEDEADSFMSRLFNSIETTNKDSF